MPISAAATTDMVTGNRPRLAYGEMSAGPAATFRDPSDELRQLLEANNRSFEARLGLRATHHRRLRYSAAAKGLPAKAMRPKQRHTLKALLDTYFGRLPDEIAEREAAKVGGEAVNGLAFAWAGPIVPGEPHYYRVQVRDLLVEYDNTQSDANHIHSVWRNPSADFARTFSPHATGTRTHRPT